MNKSYINLGFSFHNQAPQYWKTEFHVVIDLIAMDETIVTSL